MKLTADGPAKPGRNRSSSRRRALKRTKASVTSDTHRPDEEYRVGPGRPPREYQFKPGQSGNPKGATRKPKSIMPDLKSHLQEALNSKINLMQDNKERIVSKAAAGIEQVVNAFAEGDRHARRDVLDMARRLNLDLLGGQTPAAAPSPKASSSAEDEAILADFLRRHGKALAAETEPSQPHESNNNDGEEDDPPD
jgi:Family of unknown function (DUF5681)